MVCRLCKAVGTQSEAAYGRQMTGEGPYYQDRQKVRAQCRECREEMASGLMVGHIKKQHGRAAEEIWSWTLSATGE